MAERVFIQRARLGRQIFVLRDDELEIGASGRPTQTIPLRALSGEYAVGSEQFLFAVVVLLGGAAGLAAVAIWMSRVGAGLNLLAYYPAGAAVMMALTGARLVRRLEFFEFSDRRGNPAFRVVREPEQREECEAFVRDLLHRIETADAGPEVVRGAAEPDFGDGVDPPAEWRWQAAIAAGALTLGFPLVALAVPALEPMVFFVVLGSAAGSGSAAWFAFAAQERRRWWALAGVALAAVPFVVR